MNPKYGNWEALKARLKSWLWRAGMMVAALAVEFIAENIGLFNLHPLVVTAVGLLLGEVSKYLNVDVGKIRAAAPQA